ncbi:MAG: type II secretion system protein [Bdellovibrionales bacterium]|nr:type II secretion system protein [Bdellovibrionales bacterium]
MKPIDLMIRLQAFAQQFRLTPTLLRRHPRNNRGFSLIEILIAVAIFASSLLFIFPSIRKSENEIKKTLRTLQALNRTLYSHSRIQNKVYRLALKTNLQKSSYWVEVKTPLADTPAPDEESTESPEEASPPIEETSPFFQKDTNFFQTQDLPNGLYFEWMDNLAESDTIYITYDPQLLTHQIQIFLRKGSEFTWTLSFNPIVGELEIMEGENEAS